MSTTTTHIETEKKLAPALRFKEFEKDWTSFALKDITPIDEKYDFSNASGSYKIDSFKIQRKCI